MMPSIWSRRCAPFLALFLFGCLAFASLQTRIDLGKWDEALYLYRAFEFVPGLDYALGTLSPDYAPVYTLYYKLILFFDHDPIHAFFFTKFLFSFVLLPLAACLVALLATESGWTAFVAGSLFIAWQPNLLADPMLQIFNVTVLLFVLAYVLWQKSRPERIVPAVFLLPLLLYIRPEDLLFSVVVTAIVGWLSRRPVRSVAIFAFGNVVLLSVFGNPFTRYREWQTFADHFYWQNMSLFSGVPELDRFEAVSRHFNGADSILSALRARPDEFWRHMQHGFADMLALTGDMTAHLAGWPTLSPWVGGSIVVTILGLVLARREKPSRTFFLLLLVLGVGFFRGLINGVIFSPRERYMLDYGVFAVLFLSYCAWLVSRAWRLERRQSLVARSALICVALAIGVVRVVAFRQTPTVRPQVEFLRGFVGDRRSFNMMASTHLNVFTIGRVNAGDVFCVVRPDELKDQALKLGEFLRRKQIDLFVADDDVRQEIPQLGFGRAFEEFQERPAEYGYERIERPREKLTLYVARDRGAFRSSSQ